MKNNPASGKASLFLLYLFLIFSLDTFAQHLSFEWVRGINADNNANALGNDVAVDKAGNVYTCGDFYGSVDFKPQNNSHILTSGTYACYMAKYDSRGNCIWAKKIGGLKNNHTFGLNIAIDNYSNVYITGKFSNHTIDFNPDTPGITILNSLNLSDAFLAKYDANGNFQWAKCIGNSNVRDGAQPHGLAIDDTGNVYVSGFFSGKIESCSVTLNSAGREDVFLTKYDSNGNCIWGINMGGSTRDQASSVVIDQSGDIVLTGSFSGAADFDPGPGVAMLVSAGGMDIFVAKYDANGNYLWAKSMVGSGYNDGGMGEDIALDKDNNIYITGFFSGMVDFDPGLGTAILNSTSTRDIFIARYDVNGNYVWAKSMQSSTSSVGMIRLNDGYGLAVGCKYLYVTGRMEGTVDFNAGNGSAKLTSWGGADAFIAKYDLNGQYVWVGNMGGVLEDWGQGITLDSLNNVYIVGSFYSRVADFDPGPGTSALQSKGAYEAYVLKLKSDNDTSFTYLNVSSCEDTYTLDGNLYTASGRYTHKVFCDSIVILDLILGKAEKPEINVHFFLLGLNRTYASYQWIKNGAFIPGATDSVLVVTENGDYNVIVTNEHGCTDTSEIYIVTNVGTGIDDTPTLSKAIHIYPNPANDILYINSPVQVNVRINSIEGRSILYCENAKIIDINNLVPGIYWLHITDDKGLLFKVEKVVIEKL